MSPRPDLEPDPVSLDADLAASQEALVRALAAGGELPPGFVAADVKAAARSILRKRAGEVARAWPVLAAAYGTAWPDTFTEWAAERPTRGSIRDAWDFARAHKDTLPGPAALELALTEARFAYDGESAPRPRRLAVRRVPGGVAVQFRGRARVIGRRS